MQYISKEKVLALCSLGRRILFQFLIAGLVFGSAAGTHHAAPQASNDAAARTMAGGQRHVEEWQSDKVKQTKAPRGIPLVGRLRPVGYLFSAPQNPFEGLSLIQEGQALMAKQTREAATASLAKFKEAFAVSQKNNNKMVMSAARLWEGIAYDWLGKPLEALSAFLAASGYLKETGLNFLDPILLAVTGSTYASLGETDKAMDCLNRALPVLRQANVSQFTAYALKGLGEANVRIGQKHKALDYLNEALSLYQQAGDWSHEIQVLALISTLKTLLGQSTEAMTFARAAVKLAKENGDLSWEAYGRFAAGAAYFAIGNLEQAVVEYNQALQVFLAEHDKFGEASVLNNLGLIYVAYGESDLALDYFQRSLKLYKSNDEAGLAAYATNNIGTVYSRRGDPLTALRHFNEALDFAVRHKDKRLEAAVQSSLADTYFLIDNHEYALKSLKEAAAAFAAIQEPGHESEALISLADGYTVMGRYQEALDVLKPVLESRRVATDPGHQGYVLREMGYIYNHLGDPGKALMCFAQALSQLEDATDDIGKVDLYLAWGATLVSNQDYQKAEELCTKGLRLARSASLRQSESLVLALLGFLHEKQGDLAQAESFYAQGVTVSESLRSSARIEEIKTEVGSISATLLGPAILLKIKLGKWPEAFELTERARARTFLDQMNSAHIDIRKGADPELASQEQSLSFDIRLLEEKLRKERRDNPSSEASRLMAASLKEKQEAYAALLIRLKASNPEYAQLRSYSPVPLEEIQHLLGPQTTLVSYFVTADKTLAFVIRSDSLQVVEVPVKEAGLRSAINWFRDFPSMLDPKPESLKQLHDWLIVPIRQYLKTPEVVIVPHGILNYVPFAALTDGHRYFGDEHEIYYLPSVSTLPSLRRQNHRAGKRVLTVAQSQAPGFPSLRYADEEASSVAKLYHTQPLPTGRATRAEFLKRAPAYNMLHLAAHAELNATSPLFSRILLSPAKDDIGAIEVREVYGMDLAKANLVVLSACQTQLGAQSKGDDIVGLNRAFIYAGASSVIASLWVVDDEATSLLMKAFYSHLKQGMSKAAALQAAQTATRKKYPNPYYWAAFVLTGDPGK